MPKITLTVAAIQELIKDAMRRHDTYRTSILRQVLQQVRQVEIDQRRAATPSDVTAAVRKLIKINNEESTALANGGDKTAERVSMLRDQTAILEALLPAQMSGDELESLVDTTIAALGANSMRDMGRVMGQLSELTDGNLDKAQAAALVKARLSS